jgi:hypothetical protein
MARASYLINWDKYAAVSQKPTVPGNPWSHLKLTTLHHRTCVHDVPLSFLFTSTQYFNCPALHQIFKLEAHIIPYYVSEDVRYATYE